MDFPAKTMEQGCSTTLVAALDDELESEGVENGSYLMDCKVLPSEGARPWVRDEALAEKLWGLSEKLVGEKFIY